MEDGLRDDIIRMAREAELFATTSVLIKFAALVAATEREACAKVCEAEGERVDASWVSCAAAIRARG